MVRSQEEYNYLNALVLKLTQSPPLYITPCITAIQRTLPAQHGLSPHCLTAVLHCQHSPWLLSSAPPSPPLISYSTAPHSLSSLPLSFLVFTLLCHRQEFCITRPVRMHREHEKVINDAQIALITKTLPFISRYKARQYCITLYIYKHINKMLLGFVVIFIFFSIVRYLVPFAI